MAWLANLPTTLPATVRVAVFQIEPVSPFDIGVDPVRLDRVVDWHSRPDLVSIAVLRGAVSGPALRLALGTDLRVAADDTVLNFPGADTPERLLEVDVARLHELCPGRALELLLAGGEVDAATPSGLLDVVVPAAELDATVASLAQRLAATDRDVAAETKALLRAARTGRPVDQAAALQRLLSPHPAG